MQCVMCQEPKNQDWMEVCVDVSVCGRVCGPTKLVKMVQVGGGRDATLDANAANAANANATGELASLFIMCYGYC